MFARPGAGVKREVVELWAATAADGRGVGVGRVVFRRAVARFNPIEVVFCLTVGDNRRAGSRAGVPAPGEVSRRWVRVTNRSMEMTVLLVSVALLCSGTNSPREGIDSSTVKAPAEKKPARVGHIFVIGNDRTKMNVILRQVGLYPGQVLSYPDIRLAERNLARLNIFKTSPDGAVRPTVTVVDGPEGPDSEFKDVIIKVEEDNTGSLLFGVGVNSDAGLQGSVVINERNFDILRPPTSFEDIWSGRAWRGAGQEFRAEAVPGTQLQRYSVNWRDPYIFDTQFALSVGAYYFDRQYNEYTETRLGGRITLERRLGNLIDYPEAQYWRAYVGTRIENVGIHDVPDGAPPSIREVQGDNFLVALRVGAARDTRDSFLRPTSGSQLDVSFEQAGGKFAYPIVNVDYNKYWTVYQRADNSGRHVLALHSQFAWAGDSTPVYDRFYAGGFRSLRGFQFRGVGPEVNGFKVGGDFMLLNSLEYQIPIKADDTIYAVAFVDSGTVESRIDQWTNYRVAAGFGLRLVVPILGPVPIALDFGFPIVKGPNDNTQVFSFWIGFYR
jgi:outer membrane protein insertion porin family